MDTTQKQPAHALSVYREKHELSREAMATRLGVTRSYIWRIETFAILPPLKFVALVIKETKNRVKCDDFVRHLL